MITCPNCGRENADTVRLCSFCDYELRPSDAITCPTCGKLNAPDTTECPHCGTRLTGAAKPDTGSFTDDPWGDLDDVQPPAGPPPGAEPQPEAPPEPEQPEVPDWLTEAEPLDETPVEAEAPPPIPPDLTSAMDAEVPDWLADEIVPGAPAAGAVEPFAADAEPLPAEDVRDAFADLEPAGPELGEAEAEPLMSGLDDSAQDDIRGLFSDLAAETEAPLPVEPEPVADVAPEPEAEEVFESRLDEAFGPEPSAPAAPEPVPEAPFEAPPAEPGVDAEAPSWLGDFAAAGDEAAPEPEDVPEARLEDALGLGPEPTAEPEAFEPAMPDWLADTGPAAALEPEAAAEEPSQEAPGLDVGLPEAEVPSAAEERAMPDWLAEPELSAEPVEPETPTVSDDWLDAALRGEIEEAEADAEAAPPPPAPAADADEGLPDWMTPVSQPPVSVTDSETPDWLREPVEDLQDLPPLGDDDDVPDWLQAVTTARAQPPAPSEIPVEAEGEAQVAPDDEETAPQATPVAADETPDWLAEAVTDGDMPDWLKAVSTQVDTGTLPPLPGIAADEDMERAEPESPAELEPAAEAATPAFDFETPAGGLAEADVPDWLRAMQPGGEKVEEEAAPAAEPAGPVTPFEGSLDDFLEAEEAPIDAAITEAEGEEEEEGEAEAVDLDQAELPGWLRDLRTTEDGTITAQVTADAPVELPEEMEALRAATIPGALDPNVDLREESVGPLKGVVGVVAPAPVIATLQPALEAPAAVSVDQAQVSLMEGLLAEEDAGIPRADVARSVLSPVAPLGRILLSLLLLLAIGLPIVGGFMPFDAPTSVELPAADALRSLSGLNADSTVLLAFEYDPSQAGELNAEAEVLVSNLMARGVTLYAVSTQPTGPALAQNLLETLADQHGYTYGDGYVNLGYISGRATGVRGLVTGVTESTVSPLAYDYQGAPTGLGNARLADLDVDAIVLLAGTPESVRVWVEQAGNPTGIPMVAAVSAGAEPMALPYYRQGRQLEGIVSGLSGATRLALATGDPAALPPALDARWNAQVAGALAAAAAIVAGILLGAVGLGGTRRGQERP